jgi:sugar phosphate isomerase/epimerase
MNKFEFGFNVFNYPIEDFLDYASEHSINHIEINLTKPHSSLKSFDEQRIEKLKSTLNNKKIDLSLHLPNNINIADNISLLGRFNSRYLLSCIELAHKLNVKFINCHIGFFIKKNYQKHKPSN